MKNKYHSRKVTLDGKTFDSVKEARRFQELQLLERAGKITDLQTQFKYVLIPAQYEPETVGRNGKVKNGKLIERECAYFADFVYFDIDLDDVVVEDTKGFRTEVYKIKKKLLLYKYGIRIKEV